MSQPSDFTDEQRQWCLLCDLTNFTVISFQSLTPAQRVPINKYSWMIKANQRWLTIPEFRSLFGDKAANRLFDYSSTYTLARIEEMNERCKP